jgi:probable O-glycosylation ligase (exosortase A-associated)
VFRSLYLIAIYLSFFVLGRNAPFALALGYVWVDTFNPQSMAYLVLPQIPVSLIMAVATIAAFVLLERNKPRITLTSILLLLFAAWVTLTTALWAEVPDSAFEKWNYAFKMLCFAAFLPFVFRSRIQIEALLQVYLFSIAVHFIPVGLKTMVSGGGYGRALGIVSGNSLLSEGATLAGVSLMLIPIIFYLRRNTLILPKHLATQLGYNGLVALALAAAIGTYERTALVGMAVVGGGVWLRARRKILYGALGVLAMLGVASRTSDAWNARISTIGHFRSESSALGRLLVWEWTIGYANEHPLGGGFNSYKIDRVTFPPDTPGGDPIVAKGIAFHSIYFEVLGEQGYVGLAIFFAIIGWSFWQLQRVAGLTKSIKEMVWARELAYALQVALLTLLACGAFIGIAFQPMLYYLFAVSACLRAHVREVQRLGHMPAAARLETAQEPMLLAAR